MRPETPGLRPAPLADRLPWDGQWMGGGLERPYEVGAELLADLSADDLRYLAALLARSSADEPGAEPRTARTRFEITCA